MLIYLRVLCKFHTLLLLHIEGSQIKQVKKYTYLKSIVSSDADYEKEVKRRIVLAKTAFMKLRCLLTNMSLRMNQRIRSLLIRFLL